MKRTVLIKFQLFLLLFAASAFFTPQVWSEEKFHADPVAVNADISPKEITVGDPVTYTITITHEPGTSIQPLESPKEFPGLELVDQGTSPVRTQDGKTVEEYWFRLRGDRVGIHTLPAPPVRFENPSTETEGIAEILPPEVTLSIRSVLYRDGEPTDIRDIKPIVGAAWPWKQYVLPVLAFATLAFLIGYFASRWVKRNRIEPAVPAPPSLSADELALRELERLYEKGYHLRGEIRELYFEFSEIFRRYLGGRYGIPALDWTTQEIEDALADRMEPSLKDRESALEILNDSDLVKFARFEVGAEDAVRLMKSARAFIKATAKKKRTETNEAMQHAGTP